MGHVAVGILQPSGMGAHIRACQAPEGPSFGTMVRNAAVST